MKSSIPISPFRTLILILLSLCTFGTLNAAGVFVHKYYTVTVGDTFTVNPWEDAEYENGYKCLLTILETNPDPSALTVSEGKRTTVLNVPYYNSTYEVGYYCPFNVTANKVGEYYFVIRVRAFKKIYPTLYDGATFVRYHITVLKKPEVTSITIPSSISLNVGDTYTFTPVILESGATTTLTWSSSNTSIATVSNGVVTGKSAGTADITCVATNGVSASCRVTVQGEPEIAPTPNYWGGSTWISGKGELAVGDTTTLCLCGYSNGIIYRSWVVSNEYLLWQSSNTTVATIGQKTGFVTAQSPGSTTITCIYTKDGETTSYTKELTVVQAEVVKQSQTLTVDKNFIFTYGDTNYTLPTATKEGIVLNWTVANTNIAAIQSGKLVIKKPGQTTVTASNDGDDSYLPFSQDFTHTVEKAPLTISAGSYSMQQGDGLPAFTLTYTGFKNDDDASMLTKQPTVSTTATKDSPAGTYEVTVSGAESDCYAISYVNGTLTITEAKEEDVYVSIGTGTLTDNYIGGTASVEILQCEKEKERFRIVYPYKDINDPDEENHDGSEYMELVVMNTNWTLAGIPVTVDDIVFFKPTNTGVHSTKYDADVWLYHPVYFSKMDSVSYWLHSKVLAFQENGLPGKIQLAPYYYMKEIGGWNKTQEDGMVLITFPGYVEAIDDDVNGDGEVNDADLATLGSMILGTSETSASADINQDGEVDGTDYVVLANIIANKGNGSQQARSRRASAQSRASLLQEITTERANANTINTKKN